MKNELNKVIELTIGSIVFLIVGFFIIQSCSKEVSYPKPNLPTIKGIYDYTLNISEEFNNVGRLHNEGLDSVFATIEIAAIEDVKKNGLSDRKKSDIDFLSVVENATINFCKSNPQIKKHFDDNSLKSLRDFVSLYKDNLTSGKNTDISKGESLTAKQQDLVNEISKAVKSVAHGQDHLSQFKDKLNDINQIAAQTLTEEEAAQIYCGTSTAYASYQYWQQNYIKWAVVLNYSKVLKQYIAEHPELRKKIESVSKLKSGDSEVVYGPDGTPWVFLDEIIVYGTYDPGFWARCAIDINEWLANGGVYDLTMADVKGTFWSTIVALAASTVPQITVPGAIAGSCFGVFWDLIMLY